MTTIFGVVFSNLKHPVLSPLHTLQLSSFADPYSLPLQSTQEVPLPPHTPQTSLVQGTGVGVDVGINVILDVFVAVGVVDKVGVFTETDMAGVFVAVGVSAVTGMVLSSKEVVVLPMETVDVD